MPADPTPARTDSQPPSEARPRGRAPWRLLRAPAGLRWRLAGWVALVVLISSGITFVAVYRGTASQLRHEIDQEMAGDDGELTQALETAGVRSSSKLAAAASRYIEGQPFNTSSTLLFALIPGAKPSTNQPELFGSPPPDEGETAAAQDQENSQAHRLLTVGAGFSTVDVPDIGPLRLLKRSVRIPGGPRVTVGVGEPLASVTRAQRGVARAFILAGFLALAGALLASLLIGTRFSRPLRRMATVAAQVDGGDLHPRIHDVDGEGEEVRVLADAFNHMLDRLADAFAGQRAFVADASHELRTPLTVIRGQLEVLAAQEHPDEVEVRRVERLVGAEIARITRLVDDLLLLAKSEQTQFLLVEPVELASFIRELWDGISLLGQDRRFELGALPAGTLTADPDRLAQALRNLIDNAIEHTAPGTGLVARGVGRPPPPAGVWGGPPPRAAGPSACASSCGTTAPGFRPRSASASSTASIAPTPRATAPLAGPVSDWRSYERSLRPTADASRSPRATPAARVSSSSYPASRAPRPPTPRRHDRARPAIRGRRRRIAPARPSERCRAVSRWRCSRSHSP
jgi:two-component system OmpR family sensor kinase